MRWQLMLPSLIRCLSLGMGLALPTNAHGAAAFPEWKAPDGARMEVVAPEMVLNGQRSRILKMDMPGDVDTALKYFRERFGTRRVENQVQGTQVIATRDGDFFHTVQLKASGPDHVSATLITTAIEATAGRSAVLIDTEKLLPADTPVLRSMESSDGRRSLMVVAANTVGRQANRDHLVQMLQQRGLKVIKQDEHTEGGRTTLMVWLEGRQEEAVLTIVDDGRVRSLLINRSKGERP